jgi:hypothetical protein
MITESKTQLSKCTSGNCNRHTFTGKLVLRRYKSPPCAELLGHRTAQTISYNNSIRLALLAYVRNGSPLVQVQSAIRTANQNPAHGHGFKDVHPPNAALGSVRP